MKLRNFLLSVAVIAGLLCPVVPVQAEEPVLQKAHATAYCQTGQTASGVYTRDGICAGATEYVGSVIIIYQRLPDGRVGDYIGMFECLDTGGTNGLQNGTVVDVWRPDLAACQMFMDSVYENTCQGKVYIQLIEDAKG